MGPDRLVAAGRAGWWAGYALVYDWLWRGPLSDRLAEEIEALVAPGSGWLLDAGTGTGLIARRLADSAHVVGMDASAAMLRRAGRDGSGRWVRGDIRRPPFPSGTFHAVVAANVVHLSGDPESTTNALLDMVGPGGQLVLCWPRDESGPWRLYRAERRYGVRYVDATSRLAVRYLVALTGPLTGGPARVPASRVVEAVNRAVGVRPLDHTSGTALGGLSHLVVLTYRTGT